MLLRRNDKFLKKIKQRSDLIFALAVAALVHLLLFTAVTIVVEPDLKLALYPKVVFLGPILNRDTDSWISLSNKKPRSSQGEGQSGGRSFSGWNEIPYRKLEVVPEDAFYSLRRKPARITRRVSFLRFQRNSVANGRPKISTFSLVRISKKVNARTILSKFGEQPEYSRSDSAQISLDYFQRSLVKLEKMLARDDNHPKLSAQANAIYFPKRLKNVTFIRVRAKNRISPKTFTSGVQDASGRYLYRKLQLSEITYRSKVIYFPEWSKKEFKPAANIFWNSSYRRSVLYEPPMPKDHLRNDRVRGDFYLEFDFLVSPQGRIITVKKLTSSGFSEIDAQAIRYLKKWQFTPSPREQWGRIRLNFKLR